MNQTVVAGLEPAELWRAFADISDIPRGSGNEAAVIAHLAGLARELGHEHRLDSVGNLLVSLPATQGLGHLPGMILQGHVDMVCEKNAGVVHDFLRDPIRLVLDGEWLRAADTTLGADNGIAVAMMVALMRGNHPHGPLDLIFTVDEEIGLIGAQALDASMLRYRTLLNIDGEEDGTFYIGCAGGKETEGHLPLVREAAPTGLVARRIGIAGLRGGHSGADIHLQVPNALKLLARVLRGLADTSGLRLVDFAGGDKHNAIPREAFATVLVPAAAAAGLDAAVADWQAIFREELGPDAGGLRLECGSAEAGRPLGLASQTALLRLVATMPHGILFMSRTMPGLVSTSTNLARITTSEEEAFILTSQRSDIQTLLGDMADQVKLCLEQAGARAIFVREYPAWTPRPDSAILARARARYAALFPDRPITVGAIHAGLECGVIGAKQAAMDMVSFGPDIRLAHTPEERVHVASTARVWRLVLDLVAGK